MYILHTMFILWRCHMCSHIHTYTTCCFSVSACIHSLWVLYFHLWCLWTLALVLIIYFNRWNAVGWRNVRRVLSTFKSSRENLSLVPTPWGIWGRTWSPRYYFPTFPLYFSPSMHMRTCFDLGLGEAALKSCEIQMI